MAVAKSKNYSPADMEKLAELYDEGKGNTPAEIAEIMVRPVRSIIAKLVNMKIYVKQEEAASTRKTLGPSKKELVAAIREALPSLEMPDSSDVNLDGLMPASKEIIEWVQALVNEILFLTDDTDSKEESESIAA